MFQRSAWWQAWRATAARLQLPSGFVLSRSEHRSPYLPVWAVLAFAAASVILIPRVATVAQSNWIHERAVGLTVRALAWDANLMREDSIWNGVLCSLHYEVLFSLLLPTYLLACTGSRRWWAVKLVLAAGLSTVGGMIGSGLLRCMPVLAIGALLAVEWRRIAHRAAAQSPWCWAILFGVAAFLLFSRWIGVPGHWATAAIAATILVVGSQGCGTARRFGETRALKWLGARSFSLYLVHEPTIVAIAILAKSRSPLVSMLVGIPVSLATSAGLHVLVERPAHRLARRAGRVVADGLQRIHSTPRTHYAVHAEAEGV